MGWGWVKVKTEAEREMCCFSLFVFLMSLFTFSFIGLLSLWCHRWEQENPSWTGCGEVIDGLACCGEQPCAFCNLSRCGSYEQEPGQQGHLQTSGYMIHAKNRLPMQSVHFSPARPKGLHWPKQWHVSVPADLPQFILMMFGLCVLL